MIVDCKIMIETLKQCIDVIYTRFKQEPIHNQLFKSFDNNFKNTISYI